ncbi:MAG: outer membrane beta-barrel protein [Flavobacteriaceae bacterium]|nr:outer membrane beta-barrel protein [Flavobacteriaceae bacterium]
MKKLLFAVAILVATSISAQSYISVTGGYAIGSAGVKFGENITTTTAESNYGSFGQGMNTQLRMGHFFNETFGVELGFGYLHGDDQDINNVDIPGVRELEAISRGRAFGLSTSIVYNFTENLYGRFGALIKLGGRTEAIISDKTTGVTGLPAGYYSVVNAEVDFHGQPPLGFVGAMGYKHNIGKNLNIFIEAEYMGISVKRKDSEIMKMNGGVFMPDGTQILTFDLDNLPTGWSKKTEYVDSLPFGDHMANDGVLFPAKKLSEKVPYSSFGINFGITYTFGKSSKE